MFVALMLCIGAGLLIVAGILIFRVHQGYYLACPFCGSGLRLGAAVCRRCGRDIPTPERSHR